MTAKAYDPRLDSLRAIAAFLIIPHHWEVLPFGWVGVPLFFVLSGMLITDGLSRSRQRTPQLGAYLKFFFEKRMLRLFPLYYLFLLGLVLLFLALGWPPRLPSELPYLVTYTYNLHRIVHPGDIPAGFSHLWSLGVEWQFYLLWPFFVWFLRPHFLLAFALLLVFLAPVLREVTLLLASSVVGDPKLIGSAIYVAPWTHLDAMALGALLTHAPVRKFLARPLCWIIVFTVGMISGLLTVRLSGGVVPSSSLGFPPFLPYFHESIWGYSIINLMAACVIALTAEKSRLTGFADWLFLQYLGKISYGLYVYHRPLITFGVVLLGASAAHRMNGPGLPMLLLIMVVDVALAHVSYRYFESWFLRKKEKLSEPNPASA